MSDGGPRRGAATSDAVLPCGRSTDGIFEQVADGRGEVLDDHQASCLHCRAALAETDRLWAPVRSLAARAEVPPPTLVDAVMRSVRELARDLWYVVVPGARGETRIAARVVADIAQRAAARVPGVRVALGRRSRPHAVQQAQRATRDHQPRESAVGVAGRSATVDLAVVVTYGVSIGRVAAAVRASVSAALSAVASVESTQVNIFVDDVLPPPTAPRA